jgi:HrpA-like RNA helicase
MKRIVRQHPQLRVILMSATIDNKLFQYYFAEDEIDNFMTR